MAVCQYNIKNCTLQYSNNVLQDSYDIILNIWLWANSKALHVLLTNVPGL